MYKSVITKRYQPYQLFAFTKSLNVNISQKKKTQNVKEQLFSRTSLSNSVNIKTNQIPLEKNDVCFKSKKIYSDTYILEALIVQEIL